MVTRPVVDGHNDLPWAMRQVGYDFSVRDIAEPQPELHTDLARLRAGGVAGQFWSVYVPCSYRGADAVTATLEQIDAVHSWSAATRDDLALVTSRTGCSDGAQGGPVASLLGAEGGHSIDNSLGRAARPPPPRRALPDPHPQREHRLGRLGHRRASLTVV